MNAHKRPCPACGEESAKTLVYAQRFVVPSTNGIHAGYDVVVCDRCGLGYAHDPPSQEFFDTYYGELAKKDEMLDATAGFAESQSTIERNDHSLRNILPHVRPGDRILEVGCYTGYLLSKLRDAVPGVRVSGLDPSTFAATVGHERHALDIRVGTIFDADDLGRFDVVIAMHVLEHVVEPSVFVARLRRLLAAGGRLYLEVPDATRFRSWHDPSEQRAEPFFEFNFEHINYFAPDSLANLMRLGGFALTELAMQRSTLPIIASIWTAAPLTPSAETLSQLRRYVVESESIDAVIVEIITALSAREPEIIVWGAGAHTQRLLGAGLLDASTVRFFIDGNPDFRGATLAGKPIVPPEDLAAQPSLPVLISSHRFEREIAARIRREGWSNEIVTLYEQGENIESADTVPS